MNQRRKQRTKKKGYEGAKSQLEREEKILAGFSKDLVIESGIKKEDEEGSGLVAGGGGGGFNDSFDNEHSPRVARRKNQSDSSDSETSLTIRDEKDKPEISPGSSKSFYYLSAALGIIVGTAVLIIVANRRGWFG